MSLIEGSLAMRRGGNGKHRAAVIPTARPQARLTKVSSPSVPGAVEEVQRIFTTIEHMHRRKQLGSTRDASDRAFRAAERVRRAQEVLTGGIGGVMDFDRVRTASGRPSMGPSDTYMVSAGVLSDVKKLYPLDCRVVMLVAAEGYSLDETARIIRKREPSRGDKEEMGRALRAGLGALADRWWGLAEPEPSRGEIRIHRVAGARPTTAQAGMVDRGKTVHATGRKVFRVK